MAKGSTRMTIGWIGVILVIIWFISMAGRNFGASCCMVIVFGIIAYSGHKARKLAMRQVVIIQPNVQQVPIIVQTQAPAVNVQPQAQVMPTPASLAPTKTQGEWLRTARNLETARDWEGAAKAYQEAGLFGEAGRIRQENLEDDDDKVVLNIDRIGDTVLHDSVMMSDSSSTETDGTDL